MSESKNMATCKPDKSSHRPITLYDGGGWFMIYMFTGVALIGLILDYLWYVLILSIALRLRHIKTPLSKRATTGIIITAFGLLIDWLYYELTWGVLVIGDITTSPIFTSSPDHSALEILTIIVPIILIGITNYCVSRIYLHIDNKNSLVIGTIMAIFTAPWLIAAFVLLGW